MKMQDGDVLQLEHDAPSDGLHGHRCCGLVVCCKGKKDWTKLKLLNSELIT